MCQLIRSGDKFAILAVENTSVDQSLVLPLALSDTISVSAGMPVELGEDWREWLGSVMVERLDRANIAVTIRRPSSNPGVLNGENNELTKEVKAFWFGLMLTGVPHSDSIHFLTGGIPEDNAEVRQHSKESYGLGPDLRGEPINESRLRTAFDLSLGIDDLYAAGRSSRLARGFDSLVSAIEARWVEDRLHLLVRSIEGVIKPRVGRTQRDFVHRVNSTMLDGRPPHTDILNEIYELRSAVEHLNPVDETFADRNSLQDRLAIAGQRVRQAEFLALAVWRRVLRDATLRQRLFSDTGLDAFWAQRDNDRRNEWGEAYDLASVP